MDPRDLMIALLVTLVVVLAVALKRACEEDEGTTLTGTPGVAPVPVTDMHCLESLDELNGRSSPYTTLQLQAMRRVLESDRRYCLGMGRD